MNKLRFFVTICFVFSIFGCSRNYPISYEGKCRVCYVDPNHDTTCGELIGNDQTAISICQRKPNTVVVCYQNNIEKIIYRNTKH